MELRIGNNLSLDILLISYDILSIRRKQQQLIQLVTWKFDITPGRRAIAVE